MGNTRRSNAGVTLLELIIVMLVVGILGAIAVPTYRNYMMRANRTDAKTALLSAAGTLERCFSRDNAYNLAGGSCAAFAATLPYTVGSGGDYQIAADAGNGGITATAFAIKATPQGQQANDTECATFTLDDKNTRGVTGTFNANPAGCWGR